MSNEKTTTHHRKLLVDIDMLFDLRFAMVERIDPNVGVVLLHEDVWHHRDSDKVIREMLKLKARDYWRLYRQHFVALWKESLGTFLLKNLTGLSRHDNIGLPTHDATYTLVVNFPHGKIDKGIEDIVINTLKTFYDGDFDHIHISIYPHAQLSLKRLREMRITDYYCYDWAKWLRIHYRSLENELSPNLHMWFPMLKGDTDQDMYQGVNEKLLQRILAGNNLFEFVGFLHSPAFDTHWLDTYQVGLYLPDGK